VASPHLIKATLAVYWQLEDAFIDSSYEIGEEVRLLIY
jgi:hypothetical protein